MFNKNNVSKRIVVKATKKTLDKWLDNLCFLQNEFFLSIKIGPGECPLCHLFLSGQCALCPVAKSGNQCNDINSVYNLFCNTLYDLLESIEMEKDSYKIKKQHCIVLAIELIHILESALYKYTEQ